MACQLPSISPAVKPVIAATLKRFSTSVLISIRAPHSVTKAKLSGGSPTRLPRFIKGRPLSPVTAVREAFGEDLPPAQKIARVRGVAVRRGDKGRNHRKFLEALHYFVVHNITWRALPEKFGHWKSVWKRFWRLSRAHDGASYSRKLVTA